MVSITALWMPILLSAVAVFIVSSLSHMVLQLHKKDYKGLANEDEAMAALRNAGVQPGNTYVFPYCADMKEMGSPEMVAKMNQGPVGFMNIMPNGPMNMGKHLGQWFVYCVVVGIFVAYLAGHTLSAGADYLSVFRVAGTTALMAYFLAEPVRSMWKAQPWGTTARHMIDGLAYSLVTAGVFGWLWP